MSQTPPKPLAPGTGSSSPQPSIPQLTAEQYAAAVNAFSRLRSGAGQRHKGLAEFLCSNSYAIDIDNSVHNSGNGNNVDMPFMTIYDIDLTDPDSSKQLKSTEFKKVEDFALHPTPLEDEVKNQIIFLRGYPSPQWLNTIGSKYKVDPDFFARHLDFLIPETSQKFPNPALPSSLSHLVQLSVTTTGSRDQASRSYRQEDIDEIRVNDATDMARYLRDMSAGLRFRTGNAIVRQYATLDESHFAIEQRITIYVHTRTQGWSLFVWVDSGNSLDSSVPGPWSNETGTQNVTARNKVLDTMQLHPIFTYRRMDGLYPNVLEDNPVPPGQSNRFQTPQTSSLLHQNYGQTLRTEGMNRDLVYALNEIFTLFSSSEAQLLDLVSSKLRKDLEKVNADEFDSLPDLKFLKNILYRHIEQLRETITSYENMQKLAGWWRLKAEKDSETAKVDMAADHATSTMLVDLEHNLQVATALDQRCQNAITTLMSSASIAESRKAMAQQERIGKLTFLAFIFVPLSFTTSFFGMNFKEMNAESMSLYQWFAVSIPTVIFTQLAFFKTQHQLTAPWRWLRGIGKGDTGA